ncbi:MAG TPA: hypothetical protein VGA61_18525 [Anaerolineae bacterium]
MSDPPGETHSEPRTGPLRRRLASLLAGGRPRGDIIAAEVGQGAQWIAVGKNIIQIGTFVVPTLPVVALLAVTLAGLGLVGWRLVFPQRGPATMQSSFNVALAEFGGQDASGKVGPSVEGARLSQWVYQAFEAQKDQSPDLKSAVLIWHDSLPLSEKSATIGTVPGATPEERSSAAALVAARINADMVIYGNVDAAGRFAPEFYVAPRLNRGADIHGPFHLGDPIPVDFQASLALNKQLTTRTLALFWLAMGLSYDRGGLPADALAALRHAEALDAWQGPGQGKEVLYFFIGQAALFQNRDREAEAAFRQALQLSPGYAGALIGLGSVYFSRAQALQPPRLRLETADLQAAFDNYNRAIQAAPASPDRAWAQYAAPLALGMAYRLQGDAYLDAGNLAAAGPAFESAIAGIKSTLPAISQAKEYRLLGQAYLALGTADAEEADLRRRQGDPGQSRTLYQSARQAYAGCIEQAKSAPLDQILTETIVAGLCRPYDKTAADALAALGSP